MSLVPELLTRALFVALLHFTWQAVAIGLAVFFLDMWAGGRSARRRYAIELFGLLALPAVFVWTLFARDSAPADMAPWVVDAAPRWMGWVVLGWSTGVFAMLLRTGVGWWWVLRVRARAQSMGEPWAGRLRELSERLGMRRDVAFRQSARVDAPIVVGWIRPMIIVPMAFTSGLEPIAVEAILLHELAHVRRLDPLVGWLEAIIAALFFFHPVVWWLRARIRRSREHCCDDEAVQALSRDRRALRSPGRVLARALLALESRRAESSSSVPVGATGALGATGGGALLERVQRLVGAAAAHRTGKATSGKATSGKATSGSRWAWALVFAFVLAGVWAGHARTESSRSGVSSTPRITTTWLPTSVRIWAPVLLEAGRRHGVDPELLAVMTFVESRGNPWAVSRAGARGLMQLMPATAAAIAAQRGLSPPTPERLTDPAYNVDLAAWYLARQLERFETEDPTERIALAAAAYNAGPTRLAEHLRRGRPLPPETRRYRALVTALWNERHEPVSKTLSGSDGG